MGDIIHLPTPAAPTANDSGVTWRGCWHCGLVLFDDEDELCVDCRTELEHEPPATTRRWIWADTDGHWLLSHGIRPSYEYLRGSIRPETIARMASTIVEAGVDRAETRAQEWAADHLDDKAAQHAYVGDVRGRCREHLAMVCHLDAQTLGERMGWR